MALHTQKNLLVISSFPPKGQTHNDKIVGVASYTKNTLDALDSQTNITVLAEQLPDEEDAYIEHNITVKRVWKRNSLTLFPTLLKEALLYYNDTTHILIAIELAMFGGKLQLALLPIFIGILGLFGKNVTVVLHQVIDDIENMSGHIYTYTGLTAKFLNILLALYYKAILHTTSKCIVMDEVLKKRLGKFGSTKAVFVIPHGVEAFTHVPSQKAARTHLNIPQKKFVLLYFGFLAWYKGADLLVEQFAHIPKAARKNVQLIMAGGPNPNHVDKQSYLSYIKRIKTICKKEGIILTGFVQETDIARYFAAADLVIFPYRTMMSASGPLSMAFSFAKPFLISESMTTITQTKDIKAYLRKSKLPEDAFIVRTQKDFTIKLARLQTDATKLKKLADFSKAIQITRAWTSLGKSYNQTLFAKQMV